MRELHPQIRAYKVLVLTFNDAVMISRLLHDLRSVEEVVVVDSGSTDNTLKICEQYGRRVFFNPFVNQAVQCNWAIDNLFCNNDWIFRLDSDERVSEQLLKEIEATIIDSQSAFVGYVNRRMHWMNRRLRFASPNPLYIGRVFKIGFARFEEVTEEHLLHDIDRVFFKSFFFEDNLKNNDFLFWFNKHYKTANEEVSEFMSAERPDFASVFSKISDRRRRWAKFYIYYRAPIFVRAFMYFLYRYIFRLGFLDGSAGFSYCFFQAFFYRVLIDHLIFARKSTYEKNNLRI